MDRFLLYLGRLILILIGYLAACLAASAAMHLLILPQLGFSREAAEPLATAAYAFSIPFASLFIAYFALAPSAVAIAIAEAWSLRSWLYHALGGGAVGLALAALSRGSADDMLSAGGEIGILPPGSSILDVGILSIAIGSGMIGGMVYWLIAGSTSGSWKTQPRG